MPQVKKCMNCGRPLCVCLFTMIIIENILLTRRKRVNNEKNSLDFVVVPRVRQLNVQAQLDVSRRVLILTAHTSASIK